MSRSDRWARICWRELQGPERDAIQTRGDVAGPPCCWPRWNIAMIYRCWRKGIRSWLVRSRSDSKTRHLYASRKRPSATHSIDSRWCYSSVIPSSGDKHRCCWRRLSEQVSDVAQPTKYENIFIRTPRNRARRNPLTQALSVNTTALRIK